MVNLDNRPRTGEYGHIERNFYEMIETGNKKVHPTEEHLRTLWELMRGHVYIPRAWNIYGVDIVNLLNDLMNYGEPKGSISKSTFDEIYVESGCTEEQFNYVMESLSLMSRVYED